MSEENLSLAEIETLTKATALLTDSVNRAVEALRGLVGQPYGGIKIEVVGELAQITIKPPMYAEGETWAERMCRLNGIAQPADGGPIKSGQFSIGDGGAELVLPKGVAVGNVAQGLGEG